MVSPYSVPIVLTVMTPRACLCTIAAEASLISAALCTEQKGRVVVERMQDGSNAALGGLQIGDRIRGTTARSKVLIFWFPPVAFPAALMFA